MIRKAADAQTIRVFTVVFALLACTALFLGTWKKHQRLGEPGVKVVAEPLHGVDPEAEEAERVFLVGTNQVYLPQYVLDYRCVTNPVTRQVYDWLPKDTVYGQQRYVGTDGYFLDAFVVLMGADRTSIHKPQYCLTGSGWRIVSQEEDTIAMNRPVPYELPVMKLTAARTHKTADGGELELGGAFVYWFVSEDKLTARHNERMWWMARDLLTKAELQRWAYIAVFAPCPKGQEEAAFRRVEEFIQIAVPEFQTTTGERLSAARADGLRASEE